MQPTLQPSMNLVTESPSEEMTTKPTDQPTTEPSRVPSQSPTKRPSRSPTKRPTRIPTRQPTKRPTRLPTRQPTYEPTAKPAPMPLQSTAVKLALGEEIGGSININENVAVYGDTAVVGTPSAKPERAAFIFMRVGAGGEWVQKAKLVDPDDDRSYTVFGGSVAIFKDSVIIGASQAGDKNNGDAHVFVRIGDTNDYYNFGESVAIFGDTAVIGSPGEHQGGSAHIFTRNEDAWSYGTKLVPPNRASLDNFGRSVGIYDNTVVVSRHGDGGGSAPIFIRNANGWVHQTKLQSPDDGSHFGRSVAIHGQSVVVGMIHDSGSAHIFSRVGDDWAHQAKLTAPFLGGFKFGISVGIHGDTVIVGAPVWHSNSPNGLEGTVPPPETDGPGSPWWDDGLERRLRRVNAEAASDYVWPAGRSLEGPSSAHVFVRNGLDWSYHTSLLDPDESDSDEFGEGVAIHSGTFIVGGERRTYAFAPRLTDAILQASAVQLDTSRAILAQDSTKNVAIYDSTAVVGAQTNDSEKGEVFVFVKFEANGKWLQQDVLKAPDGVDGEYFGRSVWIHADSIVVGAPYDDDNGEKSGSAYIFVRVGGQWKYQSKLLAPNGAAEDRFGWTVALHKDTVVIGAVGDFYNDSHGGYAHVFVRNGGDWMHQATLLAPDGSANDHFGYSVGIYEETIVIGANKDDDNGESSGSAYIFTRDGDDWTYRQKLHPPDGSEYQFFGGCLSGHNNLWEWAVGSAHIFTRRGDNWVYQAELLAPDGSADDYFGESVGLCGEDTVIVGANMDDANGNASGSAHVFIRNGNEWSHQAKLLAPDGAADEEFGRSAACHRGKFLVGSRSGKTYVFGQ
ncbi:hypothetical protein ACHAWF_015137 [Thalassiosira exigua]